MIADQVDPKCYTTVTQARCGFRLLFFKIDSLACASLTYVVRIPGKTSSRGGWDTKRMNFGLKIWWRLADIGSKMDLGEVAVSTTCPGICSAGNTFPVGSRTRKSSQDPVTVPYVHNLV
jgi:hypothetical protein